MRLNGAVIKEYNTMREGVTNPVLPVAHRKYQTENLDDAYELGWLDCQKCIEELPSEQQEITLESAIDYLHSIGWMQEHDRIMAESAPVVHAHWNETFDYNGTCYVECSRCGLLWWIEEGTAEENEMFYCPKCGAKMD